MVNTNLTEKQKQTISIEKETEKVYYLLDYTKKTISKKEVGKNGNAVKDEIIKFDHIAKFWSAQHIIQGEIDNNKFNYLSDDAIWAWVEMGKTMKVNVSIAR